eukprot:jgi/Ulvmu1/3261/UM151_0009.1
MRIQFGGIHAIAALLLAAGCDGRISLQEHASTDQPWDVMIPEVDAWLHDFLSTATSSDASVVQFTNDGALSDTLLDDDVDFAAIVKKELEKRKQGVSEKCEACVVPVVVKVCKEAWAKLMTYCKVATDAKSEAACKHYREDPADFVVSRVLRASVNPIDGGYTYCWWRGQC